MWSVTLYGAETWALRRNEQKDWKYLRCGYGEGWSVENGQTKIIKKCSCARKSGRRKNNAGRDKEEEKKLSGPLAKKELPDEGWCRTGVFNPRPSGEFCAAREEYFTI